MVATAAQLKGVAKKKAKKKISKLKARGGVSAEAMASEVARAAEAEAVAAEAAAAEKRALLAAVAIPAPVAVPGPVPMEEAEMEMDHPENRHRLWISEDTQHFCDMENHDHAHEMLLLENLRSSHAVSHKTNGKICIYVESGDEMAEAVQWIKKQKRVNAPLHIARGCDYPACVRGRMKVGEHPEDRHRLWITKDTQHFCDMENHDHAHESKLPAEALRLVLEAPHAVLPLARCAS
jgi:hypothetical protein